MIRFLTSFVSILCVPVFSIGSTLFIGNSGEVFLVQNNYYVRDLVEAGVHTRPAFNCKTLYPDLKSSATHLAHLDIDMGLYERKLCDVEAVYPGMAKFFIMAIRMHTWTLVSETLNLLPDDGPLLVPTDFVRFQAANRTLSNVRLQSQIWSRLDPENKIALLFHEVIFAMLKFECVDKTCNIRQQPARMAREITGLLFSQNTFVSEFTMQRLRQLMQLNLNPSNYNLLLPAQVSIRISYAGVIPGLQKEPSENTDDFVTNSCALLMTQKKEGKDIEMHFIAYRQSRLTLDTVSYETVYGTEYGLKLSQASYYVSEKMQDALDEQSCRTQLRKKIASLDN